MAQVLEFKLPDLGEGLTEAEIVRWLVEVGDVVAVDQPVVEVETAKAMVEVPCPYGGVVTARFGEEGTELPVGAPLLTVAVGRARLRRRGRGLRERPGGVRHLRGTGAAEEGAAGGTVACRTRRTAAPCPRTRGRRNGSAAARESAEGPVPVISPLVRRLARENGLDLRELHGSGPDGLILRADVEYALRAAEAHGRTARLPAAPHAPVTPVPAPSPPSRPRSPLSVPPPPPPVCASPSRASAAPSPTSSPAAGGRSRTRPAGWTPTPRSSCGRGPR